MGNDMSKEELMVLYRQEQEKQKARPRDFLGEKSTAKNNIGAAAAAPAPAPAPQKKRMASYETVRLWQEYKKNAKKYASDPVGDDYDRITVQVDKNTMLALDPYILLRLDLNCTAADLRARFKTLLLSYHPDKAGYDSANEFRVVKTAYQAVKNRLEAQLKLRGALRQTVADLEDTRGDLDAAQTAMHNVHFQPGSGTNFNRAHFNSMFETHKYVDEDEQAAEDGYEKWMKDDMAGAPPPTSIPTGKGGFNSAFEAHAKKHLDTRAIQRYVEPESFYAQGVVGYQPLAEATTDFSTVGKYTDLKKAYGEANILYQGDAAAPAEPAFTSLSALKSAREKPVQEFSPEEKQWQEQKKLKAQESEQQRLKKLQTMDQRISTFYTKIHGKALELPASAF
jgi:curved DNA-binding protein CbpA